MFSLAGVALSTCLLVGAAAPPQLPSGPVLIGVWYGGGSRRPPETAAEPERERDTWRRDLETIRSLGFNSVVTWVRWASAEPARGQYRLDALEQIEALAAAMGLRVRVRVYEEPAPAWAAADRANLPSHAAAFMKVVAARAPLEEGTAGQIDVAAAGAAADLRLWGWAALARASRAIAFHAWPDLIDGEGRPTDHARAAGSFAGVVTRNLALFNPLGPRTPPPSQQEPDIVMNGTQASVHAVFLESTDALVLIAMNHNATPAAVTLTFARGTKQEFWQNMETGEVVTFSIVEGRPSLTHTFGPRDAIVLMIRKRSPYDRDGGQGAGAGDRGRERYIPGVPASSL